MQISSKKILQGEHTKRGQREVQLNFKTEMHGEINFGKDYLPRH